MIWILVLLAEPLTVHSLHSTEEICEQQRSELAVEEAVCVDASDALWFPLEGAVSSALEIDED